MLCIIGDIASAGIIGKLFPHAVTKAIVMEELRLSEIYGSERNYYENGGYSVIIDSEIDLEGVKAFVDFTNRPCEWADKIGESEYVSALYVKNNAVTVTLFMPIAVAPANVLSELDI